MANSKPALNIFGAMSAISGRTWVFGLIILVTAIPPTVPATAPAGPATAAPVTPKVVGKTQAGKLIDLVKILVFVTAF